MSEDRPEFALHCPLPHREQERILLAHGGGGRLMQELLQNTVFPLLHPQNHDGALLPFRGPKGGELAFSTDGFVVQPLEFPGGDIGSLAVHGTVNDLAMCGARPLYLSLALILEEGLEQALLERILRSLQRAAQAAGVAVVTGDTKVVERGQADGLYITTTGIGEKVSALPLNASALKPGDAILLSGDIGRHGMAIMASREGLSFETSLLSDSAPVHEAVLALLDAGLELHCLRDPTRGGVAATLHELAADAGLSMQIDESTLPVHAGVAAACELLGFDPLYVANEGKFLAFLPAAQAEQALAILRARPDGREAAMIGRVSKRDLVPVTVRTALGTTRVLDLLSGEPLPRIC